MLEVCLSVNNRQFLKKDGFGLRSRLRSQLGLMVKVRAKDLKPNDMTQLPNGPLNLNPYPRLIFYNYAVRHALCLPAEASAQAGAMRFSRGYKA